MSRAPFSPLLTMRVVCTSPSNSAGPFAFSYILVAHPNQTITFLPVTFSWLAVSPARVRPQGLLLPAASSAPSIALWAARERSFCGVPGAEVGRLERRKRPAGARQKCVPFCMSEDKEAADENQSDYRVFR